MNDSQKDSGIMAWSGNKLLIAAGLLIIVMTGIVALTWETSQEMQRHELIAQDLIAFQVHGHVVIIPEDAVRFSSSITFAHETLEYRLEIAGGDEQLIVRLTPLRLEMAGTPKGLPTGKFYIDLPTAGPFGGASYNWARYWSNDGKFMLRTKH